MQNISPNLKLEDLAPKEAFFKLEALPDSVLTLKKFTLNDRIFLNQRWPDPAEVNKIFSELKLGEISEIAFRLLKEKHLFKDLEAFRESIVTIADIQNLISATLETIGISEPIMNQMAEALNQGKKTTPNKTKKAKRIGRR